MTAALEVTAVARIPRPTRSGNGTMTVRSIKVRLENSTSGMLSMDTVCTFDPLLPSSLASL